MCERSLRFSSGCYLRWKEQWRHKNKNNQFLCVWSPARERTRPSFLFPKTTVSATFLVKNQLFQLALF